MSGLCVTTSPSTETDLRADSKVSISPDGRPSWDDYFMHIVKLVATRSTCIRRQVGAAFVKNKNILATGYNGPPSGIPHCSEVGCLRDGLGIPSGERHEICRVFWYAVHYTVYRQLKLPGQ